MWVNNPIKGCSVRTAKTTLELGRESGHFKTNDMKGYLITFTDREYYAYPDGSIWSVYSNRYLEGRRNNGLTDRRVMDFKVDGVTTNNLRSRLIYFFCKYNPQVLQKKNPKYKDFLKMPSIYHRDGDINNDKLSNLRLVESKTELANIIRKLFPEKYSNYRGSALDENKDYIKKELKKGRSFPSLAKEFSTSDMSIFRFTKRHNINLNRSNGYPKLTAKQVLAIRKSKESGAKLALVYNISESAITRVRKRKTYSSI